VAARRLGASSALEPEFGKVNVTAVWTDRLFWMLIGYQVWGFISGAIGLITRNTLLYGLHGAGYDFKAHGYTLSTTLLTLVNLAGFAGSLALCWWLFRRKGQCFGRWLGRSLQRPTTWALTFGALYLLSLSLTLIGWGMRPLVLTALGREQFGAYSVSLSVSALITILITSAVLVGLTLFLARKRLSRA
jgi:hypothetical protein